MEEENEEPESQGIILIGGGNYHYLISLRGKVADKKYFRKIKHFVFRLQTNNELVVDKDNNVKASRMVFRFAVSKKLHRKYRKIIYDGNYIAASGILRRYDASDYPEILKEHFLIELQEANEYKEDVSGKIEVPEMQELAEIYDSNELRHSLAPPPLQLPGSAELKQG
jgi:hypothetical protein